MAASEDCVADELIKGGMGQYYSKICFDKESNVTLNLYTVLLQLSGSILDISSEWHWFESSPNLLIYQYSYNFECSWFESSKHIIIMNTEAKTNCHTLIYSSPQLYSTLLEDSNQEPSQKKLQRLFALASVSILILWVLPIETNLLCTLQLS